MPLSVGEKLGPYEILAPIGAGGMGEVYRAKDTKLEREVAIKVLPAALAQDAERLARFEREAKVLASLNHPNIATIYGVEESNGVRALVMELVPGKTIKGPMSLDDGLRLATQIADALAAAHEKGITHRDLKPLNVMVTPEGIVKVLDFGLAAVSQPASANEGDPSQSPTLTISPTRAGMILGTAAYMSPEQSRGQVVDRRSDIWAFGVLLYEILTGKQLFRGDTVSDILASVLKEEPDLESVPVKVRPLLRKCLEKDPRKRLQAIGDWELLLSRDSNGTQTSLVESPAPPTLRRAYAGWIAAAVFVLVALGASWTAYTATRPGPLPIVSRFKLDAPPGLIFTNQYAAAAISPDGHYIVFGAGEGSATPLLWLRPLDSLDARQLQGTEGASFPFWSPDGKSIAFFAGGKLKRVELSGGPPLTLCDTLFGAAAVAGTWNRDGVLVFGGTNGLRRVSASGGAADLLTKTDTSRHEDGHGYPQFLPDGKTFLYFIQSADPATQGVYTGTLDHPEQRVQIVRSTVKAIYTPTTGGQPGYLLFMREQTLLAQRFDAAALRLEGEPAVVAEGVSINGLQRAAFWTSDAGLIAYRTGIAETRSKLLWLSRDGKQLSQALPEDALRSLRLSPDMGRVALARTATNGTSDDIWVLELGRSALTRLTFDPAQDRSPFWSPDGRRIVFQSNRSGTFQLYAKDANGGGQEEQLTSGPNGKYPSDWSRDGNYLLYEEVDPKTSADIWALPLEGDRKPIPLLRTPFSQQHAQFSPDGKWIAYESFESGRYEVFVRGFPTSAGQWQISVQGGMVPHWRGDGKELFYVAGGKMMAAGIRISGSKVEVDTPRELFPISFPNYGYPYDVTADGQRFLVEELVTGPVQDVAPLTVVVNWQTVLKK